MNGSQRAWETKCLGATDRQAGRQASLGTARQVIRQCPQETVAGELDRQAESTLLSRLAEEPG